MKANNISITFTVAASVTGAYKNGGANQVNGHISSVLSSLPPQSTAFVPPLLPQSRSKPSYADFPNVLPVSSLFLFLSILQNVV